ncbi:MAG: NAD(P)H-hydrate epimerase [Candidatus Caldarchaeum sp.]|uniref:NAD(P)H-hydrate epimerase n=1 Tax=Caldiarchaeum subterraneum TaxID=311458 RepID=A0A7C5Q4R8_CALS0
MQAVTSEEMMVLDANAEWMGVKRLVLMENAGKVVANRLAEALGGLERRKVLVLCGPGNNGGDGLAAARHMACMGADVKVLLLTDPSNIRTDEARVNYEAVRNMRLTIFLESVETVENLLQHTQLFDEAEAVVDAILGTGARGGLTGVYRAAVELANSSKAFKLAVDIPTGTDPDTGAGEVCLQADLTVALHKPKPVHSKQPGKTVVENIGLPEEAGLLAGPGQLKLLVRRTGVERLSSGRLAYIFGEHGPDQRVRELLTSLKGFTAFCDLNMLVENPELRYAVASSRAVLLSSDVNTASVRPFLPRSQPVVVSHLATAGVNPVYVLWSEKSVVENLKAAYRTLVKDVEELCRKLAAPVYVVGEVDSISNGLKTCLNWLGRPVKQMHFGYAQALVAWFMSAGADPLLSMASASYILRSVEPPVLETPSQLAAAVHAIIEQA